MCENILPYLFSSAIVLIVVLQNYAQFMCAKIKILTMSRKNYISPTIEVITMQVEGVIAGSNPRLRIDETKTIKKSSSIFSRELDEPSSFWEETDPEF